MLTENFTQVEKMCKCISTIWKKFQARQRITCWTYTKKIYSTWDILEHFDLLVHRNSFSNRWYIDWCIVGFTFKKLRNSEECLSIFLKSSYLCVTLNRKECISELKGSSENYQNEWINFTVLTITWALVILLVELDCFDVLYE